MTIQRMDHVGIVVDDLKATTEFFVDLGLELEGEASVEGRWADRVVGLAGGASRSSTWTRSGGPWSTSLGHEKDGWRGPFAPARPC